jgi:RimJ/RimL family protein N-acetyltransferase
LSTNLIGVESPEQSEDAIARGGRLADNAAVALRDGSTVRVRPVAESDRDQLRALLGRLSEQSRWLRFFTRSVNLDKIAGRAATTADSLGYGVVALAGTPEQIVGHAEYVRESQDRAEIAFEVDEQHHGLGIAPILLAHLVEAGRRNGIGHFAATVHASNTPMAHVFRRSGFRLVEIKAGPGLLHFEITTLA